MTGFRPLEDRLLLRPVEPPERTAGGLILPDSARARMKREMKRGTVLALGPGMTRADGRRWPMPDVAVGDVVIYDPEGSVTVNLGDGPLLHSVREDFVHAVETP